MAKSATNQSADILDLADMGMAEESHLTIKINDKPTNWVWTFAGPSHPKTIQQSNRLARERLHEDRQKEAARVNGRKWVPPQEDVEETRLRNINMVVERLIGWSPINLHGEAFQFSDENARKVLLDQSKSYILMQALEFLGNEQHFMPRSAKT